MLALVRAAFRVRVHSWQRDGKLSRNIVVIGTGDVGKRLVNHLKSWAGPGIRLLGLFDDRKTRIPAEIAGIELVTIAEETSLEEVKKELGWNEVYYQRAGRR